MTPRLLKTRKKRFHTAWLVNWQRDDMWSVSVFSFSQRISPLISETVPGVLNRRSCERTAAGLDSVLI